MSDSALRRTFSKIIDETDGLLPVFSCLSVIQFDDLLGYFCKENDLSEDEKIRLEEVIYYYEMGDFPTCL